MERNLTLIAEEGQLTKQSALLMAEKIIAQVSEGNVNPLDAMVKLTYLQTVVEAALKVVRAKAVDEADKYPEKNFSDYGAEFQLKEAGIKYDFSEDEEWRQLKEQADGCLFMLRQCEERLKKFGNCPRTSTTTLSVTLKK